MNMTTAALDKHGKATLLGGRRTSAGVAKVRWPKLWPAAWAALAGRNGLAFDMAALWSELDRL